MLNEGYGSFYNMDEYLFQDLKDKFLKEGSLGAFDFFCIIVWKANRAKSRIAKNLLKKFNNLEDAARTITSSLRNENLADFDRFRYLLDLGFRLPMLSAILTVLYPSRFLVYDYRICSNPEMSEFENLANGISNTEVFWKQYKRYIQAVEENTPSGMTLRQKDQYLWGKSFAMQLKTDIENEFNKKEEIRK